MSAHVIITDVGNNFMEKNKYNKACFIFEEADISLTACDRKKRTRIGCQLYHLSMLILSVLFIIASSVSRVLLLHIKEGTYFHFKLQT